MKKKQTKRYHSFVFLSLIIFFRSTSHVKKDIEIGVEKNRRCAV